MGREEHQPRSDDPATSPAAAFLGAIRTGAAILFRYVRHPDGLESFSYCTESGSSSGSDPFEVREADASLLWDLLDREDAERIEQMMQAARESGGEVDTRVRAVAPGERPVWLRARSRPSPPAEDGSVAWRGFIIDVTRERSDAQFTEGGRALLERIATGAPMPVLMDEVCRLVEQRMPQALASILLLDPIRKTMMVGAGPNIPVPYMRALEGIEIGPEAGSCGTAMYYGTPVISPDVFEDPKWAPFLSLAEEYGLRACWSVPFFGSDGKVAGSLSAYFHEPRHPCPRELEVMRTSAHIAGIARQRSATLEALHAAEEQLGHAQKMEAVGQLAGGIAHDFNNILTVIQGSASMLTESLSPELEEYRDAEIILQAAKRGETLTRQLLTFGRRQRWDPRAVSVNEVIRRIDGIIRRLMGERVDVRLALEASLPKVWIDEAQLEQVLINLSVNARDAMPSGGRFDLVSSLYEVEDETADLGSPAGARFVRIEARDTGVGMDPGTSSRVFEPFFSTKPRETSSGLGLSVAYGIVERAGGLITVTSALGQGACFRIDLPVATEDREPESPARAAGGLAHAALARGKTVLLVEDEPMVRSLAARTLRSRGFEVVEAEDGRAGLKALEAREGDIDIVVSDVVMPHMTGTELMEVCRAKWPSLPVLLMTGYADDIALLRKPLQVRLPLLTKPFTPSQLARHVEKALAGS